MVFYFTSSVSDPSSTLYVGKDKFESCCNQGTLLNQMQFHADNLSSAHIYLRLQAGQDWETISKDLIEDCAQLTKANSIEGTPCSFPPLFVRSYQTFTLDQKGNKKENITIIYTPWSNLKKDGGMATGQVGFHDSRKTKRILVPVRINAIINRLEKTKKVGEAEELPAAKDAYLKEQRRMKRKDAEGKRKEEERELEEKRREKEERERAWEELRAGGEGRSNEEGFDEDDFM
ncbi:uncharacterized protein KY384_006991 [Bacidia gigantensis]|uniref:uncharacterized protein n=1 Tax=Bacidia gigantensis TaxID=2732470 RepID=UPI001D03DBCD|nr:uncharacterized protein KY384_006991 [Bacidia gigantensis]KAG8528075.1 hypothetical protein KY384_006991 [Bacidia gigantensis]